MANESLILCGSAGNGSLPFKGERLVRLRMWGPHANVHLTIRDVREAMLKQVPAVFLDLIDIATYVYCADQAVTRGGDGVLDFGEKWRRNLFFRIPVRQPTFWKKTSILDQLISTLSFLSEDEYHFDFETLTKDRSFENYLKFNQTPYEGVVEDVVMFSGGIDSLGGAVQEAIINKRKIILVNHRSSPKLSRRHHHLLKLLEDQAKEYQPLHLAVRINKAKNLGGEYTQGTRSFLYVSLGATIATMLGLNRLRFYENGVVSLNLPPSPQVVGARATRTTHPQVLNGFSQLLTSLARKPFTVENPFLWKTKTEVVRLIGDAGCGKLIRFATSCTRTWEITRQHPHCGTCSQCIDRRFAILAASQEGNDPEEAYKVDLLVGERKNDEGQTGDPQTMIAAYLETANEIEKMDALQFFSRFGEASRVLKHIGGNAEATAMQIFDLHRRHAKQVTGVIDQAIAKHGSEIRKRELPATCMLRLVYDSGPLVGAEAVDVTTAAQPGRAPANYIYLKGKCWVIRFDGQEEKVYTPDIGFDYLQVLLESSGTQFSASELDCTIRRRTKTLRMRMASHADFGEDEAPITYGFAADAVIDKEGYENLSTRLMEIEELLLRLQESDSPTRLEDIEELEKEKEWITSELKKSRTPKGHKRQLGDERNRVRNRVCNAIRRALKQIEQFDVRLANHLVKPILNLGHTISYVPRDDTSWSSTSPFKS
jgi:7-cyano-7-deazaguanine synthase in queuosine biosynthesis